MHEILNDEQILDLCIRLTRYEEEAFIGPAGEFMTYYVMKYVLSMDASDEEIANAIKEIIIEADTKELWVRGFLEMSIDENGQMTYEPSAKVRELVEEPDEQKKMLGFLEDLTQGDHGND